MTGAIVTSSGDHHRGFHQCPNVLRDKYMPLIGGDGYGYLNYLLSWANTNATLSVRRMKRDLAWSQDKLQRVQSQVLEHCAHFVTMTPGDRTNANGWHLDMEKVWLENALHMAQSAAERLAKKGVPEIGTPRKSAKKGVPESGTAGVPEIGTGGVPEIGTYKDISLNTPLKTGGEYNVTGNARANQEPAAPVVEPTAAPITTTIAAREGQGGQTPPALGGQTEPASGVAVVSPDGEAADAAITDAELEFLFGDQGPATQETETVTEVQEVPGGAPARAGAPAAQEALSAADLGPHDPEETRALLVPALGGPRKLNGLMEETPPGLTAGARRGWITRITPERAAEIITAARGEAGGDNPWTYIIRHLDQEIGAQIKRGGAQGSAPAVALPTAYLTVEEKAAQAAGLPVVTAGETWYSRRTGKGYVVEEVTSQSVFVADAGEYPMGRFHDLFQGDL